MLDTLLKGRKNNPIRVGLCGCGLMGKSFIRQAFYTEGISVVAVCNRSLFKVQDTLIRLKMPFTYGTDIDKNIESKICTITDDPTLLVNSRHIDLIVDMTGSLEYSARFILGAFKNRIPVLTMNAELQATVGCALSRYATEYGVLFSDSDGDQPGVEMGLLRYMKHLGLTPAVIGNMKGFLNIHAGKKDIERWTGLNQPSKVVAFTDGSKLALEQAFVANATGASMHKRGMIGIQGNRAPIVDIYDQYPLAEISMISDYVINCERPYGVFCVAKKEVQDSSFSNEFEYLHCGKGPYYCFYTPNHLCSFDTIGSAVRMIELQDETIRPLRSPTTNVISMAKRNLEVGQVLDGIGGELSYGLCENIDVIKRDRLLPMGLIEGCVLKRKVSIDEEITFDDIDLPENRLIDRLWQESLT